MNLPENIKQGIKKQQPVTSFAGMNSLQIGQFLQEKYAAQIAQLLPVTNKLSAERIIAQATMVIAQNEGLKNCTPQSVIGGIMTAAMFGLNPLPALNQCFFIPYQENKQDAQGNWHKVSVCQFQMGYAGALKMLYNTGLVESIVAEAVHIEDRFENIRGTDAKIVHIPSNKMVTQDTILGAYCVIKLKGFGCFEMYLPKERIEHLRKKGNRGKTELSGAWKTDYGAMAVVKVIKALCKKLPFSDEILNKSFESDEEIFDITSANMVSKEIPAKVENAEVIETKEHEDLTESELLDTWQAKTVDFVLAVKRGAKKVEDMLNHEGTNLGIFNICQLIENGTIKNFDLHEDFFKIEQIAAAVQKVVENMPPQEKYAGIVEKFLKRELSELTQADIQIVSVMILDGTLSIDDVPDKWLENEKIKNAVFEIEKKGE